MFRSKLEECLKGIFEVNKVIYGDVNLGDEQNAVYVDISTVKPCPAQGGYYFRVNGKLGIVAEAVNYKWGYLKSRCQLADKKYTQYFGFSSIEENPNFGSYNDKFVKPTVNFTFRITLPYNPPAGKITIDKIKFILETFKNKLRGNK